MTHDEYLEYLKTPHWQDVRAQRLAIDGCKCAICGESPPKVNLQVHHLSYENLWREDVYSDLITLCDKCHKKIHDTIPSYCTCSDGNLYQLLCSYNLDRFIESYESNDYVHNGNLDLCNIDVIKPLLSGFYPIRLLDITSYFGSLRKEQIRKWKAQGYTYNQIRNGSKFSKNMITKTFYDERV